MKVTVFVSRHFDVDVNEKVFETIHTIHENSVNATASAEQYEEAANIIEKLTGIPVGDSAEEKSGVERIWGVYNSETEVPILEY